MAGKWDTMYEALCLKIGTGNSVTKQEIAVLLATMFPNTYRAGSQGPTDYRGILNAEGNVIRSPRQNSQYHTILFIDPSGSGMGDTYVALPKEKWLRQANVRSSVNGATNEELLAALAKRGITV